MAWARQRRKGLYALGALLAAGVVAALIAVFALSGGSRNPLSVDFTKLRGISHSKSVPWPAEINNLAQRLPFVGLHPLAQEALNLHIHQHLDIYINGKHVSVPALIGIDDNQFITELHTHPGEPNIIHVESGTKRPYSLGQFFAVWGVYLSKQCIGGYCAQPSKPLALFVNGKHYTGDPVTLQLREHQEIAIVYGHPPKQIPRSYPFGAGL